MNPFFAIPLAMLAAMLAGVVLGAPTLRLRGDYLAIVTLGFGEIIQIVATNLQGVTGGAEGVSGIPHFSVHLAGIKYQWGLSNLPYYYLLLGFVVIVLVAFRALENSRGRSCFGRRQGGRGGGPGGRDQRPQVQGDGVLDRCVDVGVRRAPRRQQDQLRRPRSDFTVQLSILVLVLVIFGGMGSLPGAVAGAAFLQWVPQFLRQHPLFGYQPQDLYIYLGALLVVMMIFRPEGMLPSASAAARDRAGRDRHRHR